MMPGTSQACKLVFLLQGISQAQNLVVRTDVLNVVSIGTSQV